MQATPAFEDLVEAHRDEIFGFLWRMLGNPADAEDALQNAFLQAYQAYPKLKSNANLRAWLFTIAANSARSQLRKQKRQPDPSPSIDTFSTDDGRPGEQKLEARQHLHQVLQCVDRLPEKQRAALMLRKYHELTYDQIGAILDCSAESARANAYQALKKLRAWLNPIPESNLEQIA